MLTTFTAPAFAGTWYIENGDITVKAGETGNDVTQNNETTYGDTGTIITNHDKDKASSNTVTIEAKDKDDKVEVTLKDVNIDTSSRVNPSATTGNDAHYAAINVTGKGDTNIELDGDNELKSGRNRAGLEHNQTVDSEGNVTSGKLTIQDENNDGRLNVTSGDFGAGIGGGSAKAGQVTITGGTITATGEDGAGIGGGHGNMSSNAGNADIEISGGTIEATGGYASAGIGGGYGAENDKDGNGNQISIKSNESGAPTVNSTGGESSIDEETGEKIPGGAGIGSGVGDAKANITLEGKVTIVAKAGEGNAAIGDMNGEQVFTGLDGSITRYDSEGNDTTLPTDPGYPVPADTSSSGGGSADASVQESVFPGLVVTDKDGQRISYTSIRGNNVLSLRVGRFTASLHASLSTLRQLRAEGIDTITFQTILCSTTLSVDELLAMGGEDTEVVLTHHIRSSTLTVGGKAV